MFGSANRKKLKAVEDVLTRSHRGIHKRIDENRELLDLLQSRAPEFLEKHFWVEGWLRSQDEFLADLLAALPIANPIPSANFPRPWPTGVRAPVVAATSDLTTPGGWGLPKDIVFRVTRGGQVSSIPCTFDQMLEYLSACGIDPCRDEAKVAGVIAGIPVELDGAVMQFEQVRINGAKIAWAMNAHPLKQINIQLQGTRHSECEIILQQIQEILGRIKRGDVQGESSDDDFGYKFAVDLQTENPSIFGNAPTTAD